MKKVFAVLIAMALTACGGATTSSSTFSSGALGGGGMGGGGMGGGGQMAPLTSPQDMSFQTILNNLRISRGLGSVAYDARLDAAAQAHADDMVARGYFDHNSPEGGTVLDRIRAQGYEPRAYAENLAGRQQTEQEALDAWINSPSHNANLNGKPFEDFGLAVAGPSNDARWVLVLGAEAAQ